MARFLCDRAFGQNTDICTDLHMIEGSDRIETLVRPGFHMIERSGRMQTFVWPGFYMISAISQSLPVAVMKHSAK